MDLVRRDGGLHLDRVGADTVIVAGVGRRGRLKSLRQGHSPVYVFRRGCRGVGRVKDAVGDGGIAYVEDGHEGGHDEEDADADKGEDDLEEGGRRVDEGYLGREETLGVDHGCWRRSAAGSRAGSEGISPDRR